MSIRAHVNTKVQCRPDNFQHRLSRLCETYLVRYLHDVKVMFVRGPGPSPEQSLGGWYIVFHIPLFPFLLSVAFLVESST